jgi:hypothetical protein
MLYVYGCLTCGLAMISLTPLAEIPNHCCSDGSEQPMAAQGTMTLGVTQ